MDRGFVVLVCGVLLIMMAGISFLVHSDNQVKISCFNAKAVAVITNEAASGKTNP